MQRVFISNTKIQETETDIVLCSDSRIGDKLKTVDTSGNTVFVIDVHCVFTKKGRELKLQEQGGVIIYRHLLQKFNGHQNKLKVVFYSPIPKDDLVKLKPENYVLKLLPFIECKNEVGQFESELTKIISDNTFPQFSNASENLLSGWSLYNESKVEVKKKRIVFVDDQADEWRKTFDEVFKLGKNGITVPDIFLYNKNGSDKVFSLSKLDNRFSESVREADLVISDFYLEENHESNNWMSAEELSKRSGFQLFQAIKGTKGIHKGVPIIIHTSSNKIQYYKFLDANGVDNWLVKDTRPNTTNQEKKENFIAFKNTIELFTEKELTSKLYSWLKDFWRRIEILEENIVDGKATWWFSAKEQSNFPQITHIYKDEATGKQKEGTINAKTANTDDVCELIEILKDSWMALRNLTNKESCFADNIGSHDIGYSAASVCNNLGKLIEFFDLTQSVKLNLYFKFLYGIRNAASHYSDYKFFTVYDAVIYFDLWLTALEKSNLSMEDVFKIETNTNEYLIQGKTGKLTYKNRMLYVYVQFYNSPYLVGDSLSKELIGKKMDWLIKKANPEILFSEINNYADLKDRVADRGFNQADAYEIIPKNSKAYIKQTNV